MNFSKLALFVAIVHQTTAHAGVNLLANSSAREGSSNGWTLTNGGDGWATNGDSADGDGVSFITSYNWCTRTQTIDLLTEGYTPEFLDSSPPILVREFFKGVNNVADFYFLRVELRDENGLVLDSWEAGSETAPLTATGVWELQEHIFTGYPAGVRQVFWQDGGDDAEFWAGHYGTLLDGAELSFNDPAPTALHLTPGTFPINAPAGGISGILDTDDTPGSSHTYELVSEIDTDTLVPLQSVWNYLDNGSDQGTAWSQPEFDDGSWLSGSAELGYGEGDELTAISGQGAHFTNYFRHSFTVDPAQLAAITGLSLRLKRDDGAIVYLNGTEIVRENFPGGPVAFNTPATSAPDDGQLFHTFTVDPGLLVAGQNLLAVEIHQVNLTSSDASFDLELNAESTGDQFDNGLFTISDNQLLFAQSGPSLPVSPGNSWIVNIRTTDNGGNFLTEKFTINAVADSTQAPNSIELDSSTVNDGQPEGTIVGSLSATDPDAGDLHLFEFVAGAGDDDNALFEISGTRLVTKTILDASQQSSATVRIRATDRSGFTTETALEITIVEFNNPPTDITLSGLTLTSMAPAGTLLGTLQTTDLDPGDTHLYSIAATLKRLELFGFGNEWSYLDDNSDPGPMWTDGGFNDAFWKTGNGNFGYGDIQNTLIDFGPNSANKYITTYFRTNVSVPTPDAYESFNLLVQRDDGVAVYLNGEQVGRDNLPEIFNASTLAPTAIGEADETTPVVFQVSSDKFSAGNNQIAAEIHQSGLGSSDLNFDLSLVGLVDASADQYFQIVNGNEIRTTAAFANASKLSGTSLDLTIRTTDPSGDSLERTFAIQVNSENPLDTDNDQLLDSWELTYFASLTTQTGNSDSDGDGYTDYEEFRFDTVPNDPDSNLGFEVTVEEIRDRVQWNSTNTRSYRLQISSDLEPGSWISGPNGLRPGTGGGMTEVVLKGGAGKRFFRLVVETP